MNLPWKSPKLLARQPQNPHQGQTWLHRESKSKMHRKGECNVQSRCLVPGDATHCLLVYLPWGCEELLGRWQFAVSVHPKVERHLVQAANMGCGRCWCNKFRTDLAVRRWIRWHLQRGPHRQSATENEHSVVFRNGKCQAICLSLHLTHLRYCSVRVAKLDILCDGAVEHDWLLYDQTNIATKPVKIQRTYVNTVHHHLQGRSDVKRDQLDMDESTRELTLYLSVCWVVESLEQTHYCTFPVATFTDQCTRSPCRTMGEF